ncbi:hypothetical protein U1Q18_040746 [Sarracenia purpurea var. burkii]
MPNKYQALSHQRGLRTVGKTVAVFKEAFKEHILEKDLKPPRSDKDIIEEALCIHDNLETLLRENTMDVELIEIFRYEKKYPESEVEIYSTCPDSLLSEMIAAVEARIRKLKGLSPVVAQAVEVKGVYCPLSGTWVALKGKGELVEDDKSGERSGANKVNILDSSSSRNGVEDWKGPTDMGHMEKQAEESFQGRNGALHLFDIMPKPKLHVPAELGLEDVAILPKPIVQEDFSQKGFEGLSEGEILKLGVEKEKQPKVF